jgi:D-3-phosphoglycerate dehydrogenase
VAAQRQDADHLAALATENDVDAILTCWAKVPAQVIDAAPRCRMVARMGIGLDNIDVAHCTRRGVLVTNVPDYCLAEVSEHALALILACGRKVALFHQQTKQGHYDLQAGLPLRRIAGQTLGIVGLGAIGRELARRAQGIGLHVVATRRSRQEPPPGVVWRTLPELLSQSDYVSLHVPLNEETRGLIGAAELHRMKPTAFLINTARGGLIDHRALAAALAEGRIAGAALDVQEVEPPDLAQPPYSDPRVIVTPHAAFMSEESLHELRVRAVRQVACVLMGQTPENIVNPEAIRVR